MKRFLVAAAATLALCGAPAFARVGEAYTTSGVNLRAGPDVYYPRVMYIPAGEPVDVRGCLEDWSWCDVVAMGERGWVAADFLEYEYEGRPVLIPEYGPRIGLSIVGFTFGYWDDHYRHRDWYGRRDYWRSYSYQHPHRYRSYSGNYSSPQYRSGTTYYRSGQARYDRGQTRYDGRYGTTTRSGTYDAPRSGAYVAPRSSTYAAPRTESRTVTTTRSGDWRERARVQQERQQSSAYQQQVERNARAQARVEREQQQSYRQAARGTERSYGRERAEQRQAYPAQQREVRAEQRQAYQAQQREARTEQRQAQAQQRQVQMQQREEVRAQVAQQQASARSERQAEKRERQVARQKEDKKDKDER